MSASLLERAESDSYILGDQLLHVRFFTAIELLAQMVIATPRSISAAALADAMGQPVRSVRVLLHSLSKFDLVYKDEKTKDFWFCAGTLGVITLADIFRCVSSLSGEPVAVRLRKRKSDLSVAVSSRTNTQQSVDLLLMQATMAVNQVVLQHLQQFDLGRLRAVASSVPFRVLNSRPGL